MEELQYSVLKEGICLARRQIRHKYADPVLVNLSVHPGKGYLKLPVNRIVEE